MNLSGLYNAKRESITLYIYIYIFFVSCSLEFLFDPIPINIIYDCFLINGFGIVLRDYFVCYWHS